MSDQLTSLLSDLQRLVQELDPPQATGGQQDEQKNKKEIGLPEGQIGARDPDTVLASKLMNAIVSSPDEKRIGEVNDLIITADGKVAGVVIGFGGDKNIALKCERFEVTAGPDGSARIVLSASTQELRQAPGFKAAVEQKLEEK
jgi:hypothetical protein